MHFIIRGIFIFEISISFFLSPFCAAHCLRHSGFLAKEKRKEKFNLVANSIITIIIMIQSSVMFSTRVRVESREGLTQELIFRSKIQQMLVFIEKKEKKKSRKKTLMRSFPVKKNEQKCEYEKKTEHCETDKRFTFIRSYGVYCGFCFFFFIWYFMWYFAHKKCLISNAIISLILLETDYCILWASTAFLFHLFVSFSLLFVWILCIAWSNAI